MAFVDAWVNWNVPYEFVSTKGGTNSYTLGHDKEIKRHTAIKARWKNIPKIPAKVEDVFEGIMSTDACFNIYLFLIHTLDYHTSNSDENGFFRLLSPTDLETLARLNSINLSPYEWKITIDIQSYLVMRQATNMAHFKKRAAEANKPSPAK